MKYVVSTFTDLLESPGGPKKISLDIMDEAFDATPGDGTVSGDFRNVRCRGQVGWLKNGTYELADREDFIPEVFVSQCIIVERTVNNRTQTKPWFISADYLIARALIETIKPENSGPKIDGSDAVGPLQVSSAEWKTFLAGAEELKVGYKEEDYDDYLMQVWGAGFTAYTDAKAVTKVRRDNGVGSDDDPPLPTYLEIFLTYLTGSAKAAVAMVDTTVSAADKGKDAAAAGPENPDKNKALNDFLKEKGGMSDGEVATLFKARAKLTGTNDANSKKVGEFVASVTTALNTALQQAFDLIAKLAPETVAPAGSGKAPWFDVAKAELAKGVKEPNPRILEYFKAINFNTNTTKTPWCAAFVSFCMKTCGNPTAAESVPKSPARAASWRNWGEALPLNSTNIPVGAVVVLSPTEKNDSSGHVSLFVKGDANSVTLLGGNQSDSVKESTYARSRVVGIQWLNTDPGAAGPSGPVGMAKLNLSKIPQGRRPVAEAIAKRFADAGFGPLQQIAAVANAMKESSLDPKQRTTTSKEDSVGLFQLNMTRGLGRGHSPEELTNADKNTDIIIKECRKFPAFGRATSLRAAVAAFVHFIERPAHQPAEIEDRLAKAESISA
jgi:uncharacterized protein (TIGR02594 family)